MSVLTEKELEKITAMYVGDNARDAADKIRGFLFQDYVTIRCLLQNHVEYVCSEYLEDVDVFFEDGRFEFIQVKYYPKTSPNMKEISTDLYYQFLRLQLLQSTLSALPRLYIYRRQKVEKPTIDKMKEYIGLESQCPDTVSYPKTEDAITWLKENVYTTNKKSEQKEKLFVAMASEESLKEFIAKFDIVQQLDINQYKEKLLEELVEAYPNPNKGDKQENWQMVLLGLAILYIQRRYTLDGPDFNKLRVAKTEFDQYMMKCSETKTEWTIVSYLVGIACEGYRGIINNNDLTKLQTCMLELIYRNTILWIKEIGKTVDGQCRLLNTISRDEATKIAEYRGMTVDGRLCYMAECKLDFLVFLHYLWKIMLNISQEKVNNETEIYEQIELFNPIYYMDLSVTDYVCLNFPEDKYANHSVILPPAVGYFKGVKRKIVERMVKMSPKPEKWFFQNSQLTRGKNYYNYSTADVSENPTVADLGEDSFYIECMECIGIDEGEWETQEVCSACIFSEKCVKEGR